MSFGPIVKTGVGVVVVKNQRVLIGKRKGSHGEGLYAFPGGGFEGYDESMFGCCEREVLEETGITCVARSPDGFRHDLFTTFDILSEDGSKRYVTCYVLADYFSGGKHSEDEKYVQPVEPNKCERWEWVRLDELEELVKNEKQATWIPVVQVVHYLKQIWGIL